MEQNYIPKTIISYLDDFGNEFYESVEMVRYENGNIWFRGRCGLPFVVWGDGTLYSAESRHIEVVETNQDEGLLDLNKDLTLGDE